MPETENPMPKAMLEAVAFASRAHRGQWRRDGETPYASHVVRVCLILRDIFGISDRRALMAALLHDTIEDTTTDYDDLEEHFGKEVADWVGLLSKDPRRPEPEREAAYEDQLSRAPWQVKVCKLADVYDNLTDVGTSDAQKVARTFKNAHRYLQALKAELPAEAQQPWAIVAELLATLEERAKAKEERAKAKGERRKGKTNEKS